MKRVFSLFLAAVMTVGTLACLASCGAEKSTDDTSKKTDEKTYVIVSDNSFKPFEYLDEKTQTFVGVDMDILAAVAEDQGFKYEMRNVGFDAACGNVQSGQADAMIAGMTIRPDREEIYDFSEPYFEDGQIMCVAANGKIAALEDLKGTTVAAKTSTMGAEYAEANKDKYGYTIQYYEDSPTMYTAVTGGANSACFEDYSVISASVKDGTALKLIGEVINPAPYGFAVKKGKNADLITKFNAGLANIKKNGKYDEILKKYGINED